jgi:transcriptional regulator with XRE-family HTH domain
MIGWTSKSTSSLQQSPRCDRFRARRFFVAVAVVDRSSLLADVGQTIAAVRQSRGWTQLEFAQRLGVAVRNLQRLESGRQNLTLETLDRVAKTLSTTPRALLSSPAEPPLPWVAAVAGLGPPERVPVIDLCAAGTFMHDGERNGASVDVEGWTLVNSTTHGTFVARVTDGAMEPLIPDGAWCLFKRAPRELVSGLVALVEYGPKDGFCHAVRRVDSTTTHDGGEGLCLVALSKKHPPIVVSLANCKILAVLDRVLGGGPPRRR